MQGGFYLPDKNPANLWWEQFEKHTNHSNNKYYIAKQVALHK